MSVDLSQFHQVFFEESYEGLDIMESSLLKLDVNAVDSESINEIFRAAHSIKGGSGTFGFHEIADFTHDIETLLDLIRAGDFDILAEHVELFLRAVDCIRTMVNQFESNIPCDTTLADELKISFIAILEGLKEQSKSLDPSVTRTFEKSLNVGADQPTGIGAEATTEISANAPAWKIYFKPSVDILKTGNDPIRMFRELSELGKLEIKPVLENLPHFSELDPESCFFAWHLVLHAEVDMSVVEEAFEWVADESEIRIEPITTEMSSNCAEQLAQVGSDDSAVSLNTSKHGTNTTSSEFLDKGEKQIHALLSPKDELSAKDALSTKSALTGKETKSETSSIRVGTDKLDSLINMVGELVITQSMLNELGKNFTLASVPRLLQGLEELSQHTRDLQENVMRIRMLPISFAFARFPRLVHDMSKALNKKVELELLGEQTELDKTVMERIGDPLVHLVRNSLDHGIELPEKRLSDHKDEMGKITLNAYHQGGNIVIQIMDDGAGLDEDRILKKAIENDLISESDALLPEQIHNLIFEPGFSTATEVTDISGRGVGMDVVKRNIQDLNGTVEVASVAGQGSTFTIRLPLTLAILDGQLIRVGKQVYIVPLVSIIESIEAQKQTIHRVSGGSDVLLIRNEYIPIIRLSGIFNIQKTEEELVHDILVIVESENMKVAVLVDELLEQQQVVIKSLQDNYRAGPGISGATILGSGLVSLILDINGLIKMADVGKGAYRKISDEADTAA